jgi:hypothetical protein
VTDEQQRAALGDRSAILELEVMGSLDRFHASSLAPSKESQERIFQVLNIPCHTPLKGSALLKNRAGPHIRWLQLPS